MKAVITFVSGVWWLKPIGFGEAPQERSLNNGFGKFQIPVEHTRSHASLQEYVEDYEEVFYNFPSHLLPKGNVRGTEKVIEATLPEPTPLPYISYRNMGNQKQRGVEQTKKRIPKNCVKCNKAFEVIESKADQLHCSIQCARPKKNILQKTCLTCKNDFEISSSNKNQKYCSYSCSHIARANENAIKRQTNPNRRVCIHCGILYERRRHRVIHSRICTQTQHNFQPVKEAS